VQQTWLVPTTNADPAKNLTTKLKNLIRVLKIWKTNISYLKSFIQRVKSLIYLLETLELYRDLSIEEWNFRNILCGKLVSLLKMQKAY